MSSQTATLSSDVSAQRGSPGFSWLALLVGLVGLGIAGMGFYQGLQEGNARPIVSWLIGFSFWFSMGIGMLFITMIWYVFGASWPIIIRRQLEHALSAFPWLALVFLPLLLVGWFYHENPGILWKWLNPDYVLPGGETVGDDVLYIKKAAFLNKDFFTIRVAFYFSFWCAWAFMLRRCSFQMERDGNACWDGRAHNISAIGIPLCALITTFAAFDFFMSLSYHWFSTMYGVWFFATSMRAGLAGTVIICYLLSTRGSLKGIYNQAHRYDLGSLCFTFTVFWAYITFCQYFLIYNANIPEETFWFNIRELGADWLKNSWWWIGLFGLIFGYFFIPFFYLLIYTNKINPKRLLAICIWILSFHIIDLYFNIVPAQKVADNTVGFTVREFSVTPWDIASLIGVGGICTWAFMRSMRKAAPIPIRDPRILGSIHHHE
ncbi:MAG: hypothetical protein Tsb0018_06020 [Opitutales bacterium]